MIKSMKPDPIIFTLANPEPEIRLEQIYDVREDAIIATGRSDYPNMVNDGLCCPFLFRGALDTHSSQINKPMQMACAMALASLARKPVPNTVKRALGGVDIEFGREYLVPSIFDPRLLTSIPQAVAQAAMASGAAREDVEDWDQYRLSLLSRVSHTYF